MREGHWRRVPETERPRNCVDLLCEQGNFQESRQESWWRDGGTVSPFASIFQE